MSSDTPQGSLGRGHLPGDREPADALGDDVLLARLRAADPVASSDVADSWIDDLTEATMRTTTHPTDATDPVAETDRVAEADRPPSATRSRWLLGAAAALVLVGAVGAGLLAGRDDTTAPPAAAPTTVMTLGLPAGNAAGMCIRFSVDVLRPMEVAFSGTATAVTDHFVTLAPDRWYKGGDGSTSVRLAALGESVALEGGIDFEQGKRYLVTATSGTVNGCGFSGEWSRDLADAYAAAFGG